MSARHAAIFGGVYMFGGATGAILAVALAASGPPDAPSPDCEKQTYTVEFGGNPANAAPIVGCMGADGVLTWWPEDQRFSIRPTDDGRLRADRWIPVKINDRYVNVWGWADRIGAKGWRTADQKTIVRPDRDPQSGDTGRFFGVVTSKLRTGHVTASDPAEAAKARAIMTDKSGPDCPNPKQPAKVPSPTVPSVLRPDWLWIGAAVLAFVVAFAVVGLAIVGLAIAKWRRG